MIRTGHIPASFHVLHRLTVNLWTARGLTNGAEGEVYAIIYEPGSGPPSLPCCIIATFPGKASCLILYICIHEEGATCLLMPILK